MSNPVVAADKWLYTTMVNDATLAGIVGTRVYGHTVPEEASYPLVYYTLLAPADNLLTLNGYVIWSPLVYAVRIVDAVEKYTSLETAAAAIVSALSRANGSNASGVIVSCVYERPFAMPEIDRDGSELRHLGGVFRLHAQ